jgi:hypothetical protein
MTEYGRRKVECGKRDGNEFGRWNGEGGKGDGNEFGRWNGEGGKGDGCHPSSDICLLLSDIRLLTSVF